MKQISLLGIGVIVIIAVVAFFFIKPQLFSPANVSPSDSNTKLPVVIVGATPPGSLDLGSRVIKKFGWDKEAGFLLELRPIFPEGAVTALIQGTVDIISIAPLTAVGLVNQKNPIVFLANGLTVNCPFFVNQESQATTWQDLKGKRLGTTSETGPSFTTFKVTMKAKEGIDVDTYFRISHSPFAELIPRLTRGEIDGAIGRCSEVGIAQAIEEAKFKVIGNLTDILFKDGTFKELMLDGVVANRKWTTAQPQTAKKFQETLYKAYEYIKIHPEIYDDDDVKRAYAIDTSPPPTISKIKELVPPFYSFVSWSELVDSQYRFFELAKQEGLLGELPPKTDLFFSAQ